jgi:hypothetical protein
MLEPLDAIRRLAPPLQFFLTALEAMVDSIDPSLDRHINRSLLNEVRVERLDFEEVVGIGFPKLLLDLLSRGCCHHYAMTYATYLRRYWS